MSDPGKAVFLSYASQDAEAAKRICDALRAAGVEVWFDAEGGLEHGDEWDAKIRRQIKECVLFLPVISANTQAREEGYFRIEWELAAQRALGIASGVAFILPVVIDGTREPDALVPDRFRTVQWTKLPGGAVPPEVLQRFLKLWSHRTGALKHEAVRATEVAASASPPVRRPVWPWIVGGLAALAVAYVAFKPRHSPEEAARVLAEAPKLAATPSIAAPAAAAASSEARQLLAKAYPLLRGLEATREDFALAEEYCQRALKLDPDDGEVWAAASQVNAAFVYRGWEATSARKEQTRVTAERAIRLAPTSVEARLAQAGAWSTFGINREEREKLLREVVRDDPTNQGALRFLAVTVLAKPDGLGECLALNERSAALPGGDPLALFNNARYLLDRGNVAEAYTNLQRSIAQKPFVSALILRMSIEITRRGDLTSAEETLRQIPQSALQEDRANYIAGLLRYYQRNAAAALEIWQAFPRDYYRDFIFEGPKGLLVGLAYELDHREAAAKIEWRAALPAVEKQIATAPNKAAPYLQQAMLLACLGEKAAAGEALRTYEQLAGLKYSDEQPMTTAVARLYARLGRFDEIFAHSPGGNRNILRVSPDFDTLRADPRFAALLVETTNAASSPAKADDKSVAVLAFANLSDDKANEYFSDGISEELLNVLAKVPGLKVSARTSAFFFKGKEVPVPEIAKQLGVAYVVEGSVRKQGDKVRITAQLIKAADGFHVWSDTFTRDLKDIFAVQDEIAGLVAQQLQLKLSMPAEARKAVHPEAYRLVLEGRYFWSYRTEAALARAEASYLKALEHDPQFAQAHAGLADVWSIRGWYRLLGGTLPSAEDFARAITEANLAIQLDATLAEPHAALGSIYFNQGRFADSGRHFQTALRLNPGYIFAHHWWAHLLIAEGRPEEGIGELNTAIRHDPLSFITLTTACTYLSILGRYPEALELNDRALALRSDVFVPTYGERAFILLKLGRKEEAVAAARVAGRDMTLQPRWWQDAEAIQVLRAAGFETEAADYAARVLATHPPDSYLRGYIVMALGRKDEALALLRKNETPSSARAALLYSAFWDEVRGDPRFTEVIQQMGLANEYQLAREALARAPKPPAGKP